MELINSFGFTVNELIELINLSDEIHEKVKKALQVNGCNIYEAISLSAFCDDKFQMALQLSSLGFHCQHIRTILKNGFSDYNRAPELSLGRNIEPMRVMNIINIENQKRRKNVVDTKLDDDEVGIYAQISPSIGYFGRFIGIVRG
ncbi:MAG: hypothetical protein IJ877_01850 [Candidatus Gastranaerophilales bacterium]|nr:hypothetical protein [Candidatus Gastranaerophilales bacterium]